MFVNGKLSFVGVGGDACKDRYYSNAQAGPQKPTTPAEVADLDPGGSSHDAKGKIAKSEQPTSVLQTPKNSGEIKDKSPKPFFSVPSTSREGPSTSSSSHSSAKVRKEDDVRAVFSTEQERRGTKRSHAVALESEEESDDEDNERLFSSKQKRMFVLNRDMSVAQYGEMMQNFQNSRGGSQNAGKWKLLAKEDIAFARNPARAKEVYLRTPKCFNCNERGHFSRTCPKPPRGESFCWVCGKDDHVVYDNDARCPNKICCRCSSSDHSSENCPVYHRGKGQCGMCKSRYHDISCCPDWWRRYYQTTSGTIPIENPEEAKKKGDGSRLFQVHSFKPPDVEAAEKGLKFKKFPAVVSATTGRPVKSFDALLKETKATVPKVLAKEKRDSPKNVSRGSDRPGGSKDISLPGGSGAGKPSGNPRSERDAGRGRRGEEEEEVIIIHDEDEDIEEDPRDMRDEISCLGSSRGGWNDSRERETPRRRGGFRGRGCSNYRGGSGGLHSLDDFDRNGRFHGNGGGGGFGGSRWHGIKKPGGRSPGGRSRGGGRARPRGNGSNRSGGSRGRWHRQ